MGKKSNESKVSKFARGAAAATPDAPRGEDFDPGKWVVRFADCTEADNGSFCLKFEGAGKHSKIGERAAWLSTTGKAVYIAEKRAKSLCMALVGAESDEDYKEFDPRGEFLGAVFPYDAEAAAAYLVEAGKAKSEAKATALIEGATFQIKITKGGEKDDGGFFRNVDGFSLIDGDAADEDSEDEDSEDEDDAPDSKERPAKRAAKKTTSKRRPVDEDDSEDEDDSDDSDEDSEDDDEPDSEPAPRAKKKAKRK